MMLLVGAAYLLHKLGVDVDSILTFEGGVIGLLISFIFPICIHIKCVHVDQSSGMVKGDHARNL